MHGLSLNLLFNMDFKPEGTAREKLNALKIVAAALSAGVLIFTMISIAVNQFKGPFLLEEIEKIRSFLLPLMTGLALLALLIARYLYQQRIREIREGSDGLDGKVLKYRAAVILYLAICEGTALLNVILFLLSGFYPLLILTGAMLLLMLGKLYAMKGVATELNLDWNEQEALK
jgi:hypothetical protein